jgi:hypothetical protein
VRLDVESLQKIPGLWITVGQHYAGGGDNVYYGKYEIKYAPSFYLPSGIQERIELVGGPVLSYYHNHFQFDLQNGNNRNITLVISENWILFGNVAFTPGTLAILSASITILILTIFLSRKEITKSPVVAPFIFLFLGSILPAYVTIFQEGGLLIAFSPAICTEISSYADTATAVYFPYSSFNPIDLALFGFLLLVFLAMLLEVLKDEIKIKNTDFLIAIPIFCSLLIQWSLAIGQLYRSFTYQVNIGLGPFLVTGAFLLWFVLFKRQGKHIFESTSHS